MTRVLWWLAALLLATGFARLGYWQQGRAVEKARLLADSARVLAERRAVPLSAARQAQGLAWAEGSGRFDGPVLWLDNQQRGGRVGVRAFAPFTADDGTYLLVDVGWAPIAPDRARLPRLALPTGAVRVAGLLAPPPSAGLRMGAPVARHPDGWLLLRMEQEALRTALGRAPAARVLRLDPAIGFGLPRDLALLANTLSPDKHRGYAVQWYGLALTVLAVAGVLTLRQWRR